MIGHRGKADRKHEPHDAEAAEPHAADTLAINAATMAAATPLGLDGPPPWTARHPRAPASALDTHEIASSKTRAAFGQSLLTPTAAPPKKKGFVSRVREQIQGAAAPAQKAAEPAPPPEPAAPRKQSLGSIIRDALSPAGIAQIKAMMYDPKLALTIPMRDLMAKLGRYGEIGDKEGVRRTVGELADKLNVETLPHSAVLVEQKLAGLVPVPMANPPDPSTTKKSVPATQGGRTILGLASILGENGTLSWKDGLDRGWQKITERFAFQAQGNVDVLVAPGTVAAPPPPPVPTGTGQWATPAAPPPAVGAWTAPSDAAPAVGEWSAPGPAKAGTPQGTGTWASPDPTQPHDAVGQWSAPPPAGDPGQPPAGVGAWDAGPKKGAEGAPAVGQWSAPAGEAGKSGGPVGQWSQAPAAGAAPPVGAWSTPDKPGGANTAGVGQWASPESGGAPASAPSIGQWSAPAAACPSPDGPSAKAPVGAWGTPPPVAAVPGTPPPVAAAAPAVHGLDAIKITNGLSLGDLVRQNPNITGLRILEYAQQPKGGGMFRELANVGASLFHKTPG